MSAYRTTPSPCPECGYLLDACQSVAEDESNRLPAPDDYSLCLQCGTILQFNADLTPRRADNIPPEVAVMREWMMRLQRIHKAPLN